MIGALLVALAVLAGGACGGETTAATDTASADTVALDTAPPPACPPGDLGCACDEGDVCARGQCVAGECALCTRGEAGCLCRADGSCEDDVLLCADGLCAVCPPGDVGCACADGACDEGATCSDGVCAAVACAPGAQGCPCRRLSAPACDGALSCLGDGTCHLCDADRAGCGCDAAVGCSDGLLCDGARCRSPRTCQDLVDLGYCQEHQACTAEAGVDAVCDAESCEPGYVLLHDGRCVAGRPNCASDAPGSLLDQCTSLLRQCVDDGVTAQCGGCVDDAVVKDGECVGRLACGDTSCLNSQYCDISGAAPTCTPLPCPPDEAADPDGTCRPCNFSCAGEGLTGRVWPFRTNTSACICETTPGYFMPPGGDTRPDECDVDADGWVREEVRNPAVTSDPALVANARCGLVEVDTVLLRDELGTDVPVVSCLEGLLRDPEPTQCTGRIPMPLIESRRNDTPGGMVGATTPPYGGRPLDAREVNALTKACVSALGDYNDDGVEDLLEVQTPPSRISSSARERLTSFSYFIETHRAYVERDAAETPRLVIEERYRCDPNDFPLRYDPTAPPSADPADAYAADAPATYWRSCTRGVDPTYDPDADPPEPGYDFAQWQCPSGGAGCDSIAPGAPHPHQDLRTPIPFGSAFPDNATLCELGSQFPADHVWRGMNHASQFKCVGIGEGPGRRPLSAFGGNGELVMNVCEAKACPPSDPGCAESRPVVPGALSRDPRLSCRATSDVTSSDVGFAAVRYKPYGIGFGGVYDGGCISEDTEYADTLCPEPVFTVSPAADAFGANTCHIAPCPFGKADCDGNPLNGCELDATSNQNCSGCGVVCAPARGVGDCSTGLCRVVSCQAGWEDCDHDAANGCETNTRTLTDCGGCDVTCTVDGGEPSCATGVCQVADCADGFGDCDSVADCETPLTTTLDCGGCDIPCAPSHGTGSCASGSCDITGCDPGFDDCDENPANGCEAALTTAANCGECGAPCQRSHGNTSCSSGQCTLTTCASSYGNCDGDPDNGCEAYLPTAIDHCGGCNKPCAPAGATGQCVAGACKIASCAKGRANCDSNVQNGCEVDNDNGASCGGAIDLGSIDADTKCGVVCTVNTAWRVDSSRTGRGEAWFKVRQVDALGICSEDLRHRVTLGVPSGVDYDVYIWDACGGNLLTKGTSGSGSDETLTFGRDDTGTGDQSFNYWIEVRYFGGASCSEWTLTIEGRNTGC